MLGGCASSAGSRRPSGLWRELYAQGDEPCARFAELRREQIAADRRLIACREALTEGRVDATLILNRPGDLQ